MTGVQTCALPILTLTDTLFKSLINISIKSKSIGPISAAYERTFRVSPLTNFRVIAGINKPKPIRAPVTFVKGPIRNDAPRATKNVVVGELFLIRRAIKNEVMIPTSTKGAKALTWTLFNSVKDPKVQKSPLCSSFRVSKITIKLRVKVSKIPFIRNLFFIK